MKKRALAILLCLCMMSVLFPAAAFAEGAEEAAEAPVCVCETACAADSMNAACPVCGAEDAAVEGCGRYVAPPVCSCETACAADSMNAACPVCGAEGAAVEGCGKYVAPEEKTQPEEPKLQMARSTTAVLAASDISVTYLSITVVAREGQEYAVMQGEIAVAMPIPEDAWQKPTGSTITFTGLSANTPYRVSTRMMATETSPAGGSVTRGVTTLSAPLSAATISDVSGVGVAAPDKRAVPSTVVTIPTGAKYTAAVEWYEGESATGTPMSATAKTEANCKYTAKITLTANEGESFAVELNNTSSDGYAITWPDANHLTLIKTFTTPENEPLSGTGAVLTYYISDDYADESGDEDAQWYRYLHVRVTGLPEDHGYIHFQVKIEGRALAYFTQSSPDRTSFAQRIANNDAVIGKRLIIKVICGNYSGEISVTTNPVRKAAGPTTAPTAPILSANAASVSVTNGVRAQEYAITTTDTEPTTGWQKPDTEGKFDFTDGILPGTTYYVWTRIAETKTTERGTQTASASVTTRTVSPLTITGVSAVDRDYEAGNTSVTLSGGTLQGVQEGDDVGFTLGTGTIENANAGADKAVTTAIVLTGADAVNYTLTQPSVTVTINKATPSCTTPTGLTATYGQKLKDITLPDGWSWKDGETPLNFVGKSPAYTVVFTPADTANYKTVEESVYVQVSPAPHADENIGVAAPAGSSGTIDLSRFCVDGGTCALVGEPNDTDGILDGAPTLDADKSLSFKFKNDSALTGKSASIKVNVTSSTHETYSINVTLYVKSDAGVSIAEDTAVTVCGTAITVTATKTTEEDGAWSWSFDRNYFVAVGATDAASITLMPIKATASASTVTASFAGNTVFGADSIAVTVKPKTTVSFDANGGSVSTASATTDIDGKLSSLPTPTRKGNYSFAGWYTEKTGGTRITTDTVFTADTTVYAHWTHIKTPKTGDESGMALWLTLLIVSGGALTATVICGKKKNGFGK